MSHEESDLSSMSIYTETLRDLIEPWLAAEQVELDDLELVGSGKSQTLRVLVDTKDGMDVDRIAELSLGLSALLDSDTDLDEPYRLEVSSPGLERKLRSPRHFEKSIGKEVSVKIRREGQTEVLKGVLDGADAEGFVVEVDGEDRRARYDEITSAKTVFKWQAAPKPGKGPKPGKSPAPAENPRSVS